MAIKWGEGGGLGHSEWFFILTNLTIKLKLKILARLVEWVELLTALGAERIFAYNLEVHPNMTKVKLGGSPKYDQGKTKRFAQISPR